MQAWSFRHSAPLRSVGLARRAVSIAERTPIKTPAGYDFRSKAWAHYGNGLRICGQFAESEAAFLAARECAALGLHLPADAARLHEFEASLHDLQHHPALSMMSLRAAMELRLECMDATGAVRVLMKMAKFQAVDDPVKAIRTLVHAGELLDGEAHPDLATDLAHNLAVYHLDAGAADSAQSYYLALVATASPFACEGRCRRLRWLRGRIAASFGELSAAAEDLQGVRQEFASASLPLETAQIGLDLALVIALAGDRIQAQEILRETGALFSCLSLAPESRAIELLSLGLEALPRLIVAFRRDARLAPRRMRL